ncbi:MAG: 4Fe-4S dicluster domain-containing protein [Planctomycetes bacterium]|nr:4Fe-4S dicluster domain-containing protein [Planctomycetota bacterium]
MNNSATASDVAVGVTASRQRPAIRSVVRTLVLALTVLLLIPPSAAWALAVIVPSLSPFVALTAVVGVHAVSWTVWVGVAVGGIVTVRRRWFCRWICPVGLLADAATRAGLRCGRHAGRLPPVGQWIFWSTVGGACVGYPVLVWLDPLALFSGSFTILINPASGTAWWSLVGLATVLIASAVWPGLWCGRLCPLGAMQDSLGSIGQAIRRLPILRSKRRETSIDNEPDDPSSYENATSTGALVSSRLRTGHGVAATEPVSFQSGHGRNGAVDVRAGSHRSSGGSLGSSNASLHSDRGRPNQGSRLAVSRRFLLATLLGGVWASAARVLHGKVPPPLRPPGARDETRFVGLCVRCGNCVRVCPVRIIRPDGAEHGLAGLLAPILDFREDYCREDCTRCTQVCPSGALARLTLEEKPAAAIGLAHVDMDLCLLRDERECSACRNSCPYDAIAYVWSDVDYMTTPQIDPEKCPGCGACEQACPTHPTKAIAVRPRRVL